ncbi:ABC transporter permease [Halobium palmae]|uniref:ABC transporter permease n=1 Tax=Halobium palmae TaxID=1776492 RepID=A0ABD5RV19_9EURY
MTASAAAASWLDVAVASVFTEWISYILENDRQFLTLLQGHLVMVGVGELLAISIALPAGIVATRDPLAARVIENLGAIAQTIPALGVVALTFTVLGLGKAPTILAITIYALFPVLKNTVAGIQNVDESKTRAGRGMGMTNFQRLRRIEIPLALPVIFAGIRTSTVLSVGVAYIGVFVGAGGLGVWIQAGLTTVSYDVMLAGAIPGALTVIAFDRIFAYLEGVVTPEGVTRRQTDGAAA